MARLSDLEACFIRYEVIVEEYKSVPEQYKGTENFEAWIEAGRPFEQAVGPRHYTHEVSTLEEAQGVSFLCPKCWTENKGSIGTHWCEVSFEGRNVPDDSGSHGSDGSPTRWLVLGSSLEDLTTEPAIQIQGLCNWYGYIRNGEATLG